MTSSMPRTLRATRPCSGRPSPSSPARGPRSRNRYCKRRRCSPPQEQPPPTRAVTPSAQRVRPSNTAKPSCSNASSRRTPQPAMPWAATASACCTSPCLRTRWTWSACSSALARIPSPEGATGASPSTALRRRPRTLCSAAAPRARSCSCPGTLCVRDGMRSASSAGGRRGSRTLLPSTRPGRSRRTRRTRTSWKSWRWARASCHSTTPSTASGPTRATSVRPQGASFHPPRNSSGRRRRPWSRKGWRGRRSATRPGSPAHPRCSRCSRTRASPASATRRRRRRRARATRPWRRPLPRGRR
mmetsp:Transcript_19793/g.66554  ORF Transcript_19793/g.66554 Transcript_19793/m.66554 type:complete len:301 (-) Transcript_19793:1235-2137(-)